jgi:long-chain acyl-CoA synthetase
MNNAILITGATGFLGTQVTRFVINQTDKSVIVLVRGKDLVTAKLRLERAWWDWPELIKAMDCRICILNGDVSEHQLGLNDPDYRELTVRVSHIIHLAADIRLQEPLESLRRTNVKSVENLLELAYTIQGLHGLTRFSHVSTAYVAGRRTGEIPEEALTRQYGFANHYELTKFEAECLIEGAKADLPISVFRPGMIVGDSQSGAIKTFNTLYFPLRLYLTGKIKFFPVDPDMKVNLVPCDYVAEAIVQLTLDPQAVGLNFHLTLPAESIPTVREMIQLTRQWALEKLKLRLPVPVFVRFPFLHFTWLRHFFASKSPIRSLFSLAAYFEEKRIYRRDNLDRLFGEYQNDWRVFFPKVLDYAVSKGFMHRSERTVHEQAYFRLTRKSRRVRYYDIVGGKAIYRSAGEIRREIEAATESLVQLGIKTGDRIAIVGFNSTRYLIVDIAVGLCGGVSVPLYYSSPVRELADIIHDSGARIFFVGVPEILEKLATTEAVDGQNLKITVVSFCREVPDFNLPENFMDWQRFITLGSGLTAQSHTIQINFDAPATLRYTSGTTGHPKGALFTHAQLRWMAETLASLPPWPARTRKIFYLSFLPMNHVVEGILAGYALYYAPAPFDIYYLEDFHELQKVVPKVRPTVFFSVPRFYEKVWQKAAQSLIGLMYRRSKKGFQKRLLKNILRYAVCRAAGISRCAQLIVGSAPVSAGLLQAYREIGIEIHNAYGLTEAPLITLNRFHANHIDTVGQPLPDTQIRIAPDGEVLVKGPQVMSGYFRNASETTLTDGWLHTGDLGSLTNDNYLVIQGRKKEIIIDAYGKNINPSKVELLLIEYTGINHIMVYGDNKPYCTALFWCSEIQTPRVRAAVETGVKKANAQLSRPEQIKRWVILTDTLSINEGELTANLKMKRLAISQKYVEIIEALYDQDKEKSFIYPDISFGRID